MVMSRTASTPPEGNAILDLMLDPISRCFDAESARKLIDLRLDPAVQERVDLLAEKANEGLMTEPERAEYEAYINTDDFLSILKLKARRYLATTGLA
jgi:hypothetical protein